MAVSSPILCAGGKPAPPSLQPCVPFPLGTHRQLAFVRLFPLGALCHSRRLAGFWGRQAGDAASPQAGIAAQRCPVGFGAWVSLEERDTLSELRRDSFPAGGDEDYRGSVNLARARPKAVAVAVPFWANASCRWQCHHEFNPIKCGSFSGARGPARHALCYRVPLIPGPSCRCLRSKQNLAM